MHTFNGCICDDTSHHRPSTSSQLNLKADNNNNNNNDWFGPTVTAVAGLTLASQMAVASVGMDPAAIQQDTSIAPIIRQGKRHLSLTSPALKLLLRTQHQPRSFSFVYVKLLYQMKVLRNRF